MMSDEDLELISALLSVTVTSDSSGLLGDSAVAEIRALRRVAEAAIVVVQNHDGTFELYTALEEAGYKL